MSKGLSKPRHVESGVEVATLMIVRSALTEASGTHHQPLLRRRFAKNALRGNAIAAFRLRLLSRA
jgi:hypothetical protein